MLIKLLSPSIRNAILYLILDYFTVRVLSQSSHERLFMQLIKLIIELSNHVLNIYRLFLSVYTRVNGSFNISDAIEALLNVLIIRFFL